MRESFDSRVQRNMFNLSDTESEIVQYLRSNRESLGTIRDTAKELYIVPNTLFRLAKKLGYAGWSEMKYDICGGQDKGQGIVDLLPTSSMTVANLKRTVEALDRRDIELLLKKIETSGTIVIYGIGDNKYFCELLIKYLRIGDSAKHVLYDSDFTIGSLTPNDTAIFLSYSGTTAMTVRMAELARSRGAFTVSITGAGTENNEVRRLADMNLVYYNLDPPVADRLAPDLTGLMYIIREIAASYWRSKRTWQLL